MTEPIIPKLYTEIDAAAMLGVSRWKLRHDRSVGRGIRYVKIGTRSIRYRLEDIQEYLNGVLVEPSGN